MMLKSNSVMIGIVLAGLAALPACSTVKQAGNWALGYRGDESLAIQQDVSSDADHHALAAWYAPIPHNTSTKNLVDWWSQFNNPALVELINAAQAVSPTLSAAKNRIEQAQAGRAAAGNLPSVNLFGNASKGVSQVSVPVTSIATAGAQASWVLDVFGASRAQSSAADERLASAQVGWHDARILVAAQTASLYFDTHNCLAQSSITAQQLVSLEHSSQLTQLLEKVGLNAPMNTQSMLAALDSSRAGLQQQKAQCDMLVKSLVALTGEVEPTVRKQLATPWVMRRNVMVNGIPSVPAALLQQRPDIYAAAKNMAAARYDLRFNQAQRYPQLSLSGNIGHSFVKMAGLNTDFNSWSVGPLSLTLPLFDGGKRRANIKAAEAAYNDAVVQYKATVSKAVSEVESAFVGVDSAQIRLQSVQSECNRLQRIQQQVEKKYASGVASQLDVENAKRQLLTAQQALANVDNDYAQAEVNLYKAVGGGWNAPK